MVNEEVDVDSKKALWSGKEMRVMVQKETRTKMNEEALIKASRTLSAYQNMRARQKYKNLVKAAVDDLRAIFATTRTTSSPAEHTSENGEDSRTPTPVSRCCTEPDIPECATDLRNRSLPRDLVRQFLFGGVTCTIAFPR